MKFFDNIKTGRKILIGFLAVSILTALVGIIGLYELNQSAEHLQIIYSERLLANVELTKIQESLLESKAESFKNSMEIRRYTKQGRSSSSRRLFDNHQCHYRCSFCSL
jgi:hypothetical protein